MLVIDVHVVWYMMVNMVFNFVNINEGEVTLLANDLGNTYLSLLSGLFVVSRDHLTSNKN